MGSTQTKVVVNKQKKSKTAGSKKGRQHDRHKMKCMRQFDRTSKNKNKAWKLHLKNHPNDVVAKKNIERVMGVF
jgi:hypothetical protein